MRNTSLISSHQVLFGLFLLLLTAGGIAFYSENALILGLTLLLSIPLFALLYFLKYNVLSLSMVFFLVFFFLGNVFSSILLDAKYSNVPNILYLLGLNSLVINVLSKFKLIQINKLLRVYFIALFAISLCFLFEISHMFSSLLSNVEIYVFVFQGLTLLVLGFLAFCVCLHVQTKSIIHFLIAVICFGFAKAMDYITYYYLYDFSFVLLNSLFYLSGLYFIFKFMLGEGENGYKKPIEKCQVLYSEIVVS